MYLGLSIQQHTQQSYQHRRTRCIWHSLRISSMRINRLLNLRGSWIGYGGLKSLGSTLTYATPALSVAIGISKLTGRSWPDSSVCANIGFAGQFLNTGGSASIHWGTELFHPTCRCRGISWASDKGAKHPCKSNRRHGLVSYSVTPNKT